MCSPCRLHQGLFNHQEDIVVKDEVNHLVRTSLPFTPEVLYMRSNKAHFLKVQQSTEARISKQGLTEQYNQEIQKYLDNGVIVPIMEEDKTIKMGQSITLPTSPSSTPALCPPPSELWQTQLFQTSTPSSV